MAPAVVLAGTVLVNNPNAITIVPSTASTRFQKELDQIAGFKAQNARLTFSLDKGIEGSASPVDVDMLKVEGYDDAKYQFIGTTTGSMKITGSVYAQNGKIAFNRASITPATLSVFKIENAVENVFNSYIGDKYIGSVDVINNQVIAHIIPNPGVSGGASSSGGGLKTGGYEGGIVPDCNKTGETVTEGYYLRFSTPCNFEMLMKLVNNVINFLLVYFATPLAAIIFAYAGFTLITSGGNEHGKTHAKAMIKNVLVGYIIALAAWLIINTILSAFLTPEAMNWSFLDRS